MSKVKNFIIIVREPSEHTCDFLAGNFPILSNGDSIILPFDCLEDIKESSVEFEIVEY